MYNTEDTIFDMFDRVYVINRPVDITRREEIIKELQGICDTYKLFPAVDGWNETIEFKVTEDNKIYDGWTPGAAGLVETTIQIIKEAKENKYKQILILEDDLKFNYSLQEAVKSFNRVPDNWELMHFASKDYIRPKRLGKLKRLAGAWSCQIYGVSERIYDEYLSELSKKDKPIDLITSSVFHPRGNSYATRHDVITTYPNFSSIRNKQVNYR